MKRIDDIEILRAIAISMVLIAHTPILLGWPWKYFSSISSHLYLGTGVDLFLAISGFVITRSLNESEILSFWIRRAFRILPAAWLWLAIGMVLTAYFNSSGIFGSLAVNLKDAAASFLQVQNVHYGFCVEEIGGACAKGGIPFGIYWSLSLEEQFYVLLPLLFLLPRKALIAGLVIAALVQIASVRSPMQAQLRTDALILGVLLALWSQHKSYQSFRPAFMRNEVVRVAVICGLLTALATVPGWSPNHIGIAALISAVLVFVASFDAGYIPAPFRPLLLWAGSRSYSLYLTHLIAYCCTVEIWFLLTGQVGAMSFRYVLTAIPLLLILSEATYRFVELPMRLKGREVATRRAVAHQS